MTAVLVRPRSTAALQVHLNHFLRFLVQVTPHFGEHRQLMTTTLKYLLSIAQNSLYKIRIKSALAKVTEAVVQREGAGNTANVQMSLKEYSALYRDLMDRIVTSNDETWLLPASGSTPSTEEREMDQAWQTAKIQWEISAVWDLAIS